MGNYNHAYQNILYLVNLIQFNLREDHILDTKILRRRILNIVEAQSELFNKAFSIESFNWIKPGMDKEWVASYLTKHLNLDEINKDESLIKLPPLDKSILLFDHLSIHVDTKKIVILNLKKAWQQKQFRNKLKSKKKKPYSIVMSNDIDKKWI